VFLGRLLFGRFFGLIGWSGCWIERGSFGCRLVLIRIIRIIRNVFGRIRSLRNFMVRRV
jgi:hypothetical protein